MPYNARYFIFFLCLTAGTLLSILPHFPIPAGKADILIVSPHPDDAVLCCAGLILQALEQKKRVHIVEMTDGDGYVDAAALETRKPAGLLTPLDMRRLGRVRRNEEIRAMQTLGLKRNHITFLGYPDGWLDEVYNAGVEPFRSPFTGLSQSASSDTPYTKSSVIADLASMINRLTPTYVYVSGNSDSALDHRVTYKFMTDAVRISEYTGKLFIYANHATGSGSLLSDHRITLTQEQKQMKADAISAYTSQLPLDGEYLRSFAETEELFY